VGSFVGRRLMLALLAAPFLGLVGPSHGALASGEASDITLDLVVLVDESESLRSTDVANEIEAVKRLVGRRELWGGDVQVRIAIAGFGSGLAAVDEKCPLSLVTIDNVEEFARCADRIQRRGSTGQHTDFAQALEYAAGVLGSGGETGAARVVVLMTDGKYDPLGRRSASGLTADDERALSVSAARLNDAGAQIWPLGFGNVSEEELVGLAEQGAPSRCQGGSRPRPFIGDGGSLDGYLLEILGATICADIDPPQVIPYDYAVHPFVDDVTLTVRNADGEPSVVVAETRKELCRGQWTEARDGSLSCRVAVTGDDVGIWQITSSSSGGEGVGAPTVETSQSGSINLRFEGCERDDVRVRVTRLDGTQIRWDAVGELGYPRVSLIDDAANVGVGSVVLEDDVVVFAGELTGSAGIEALSLRLSPDQDGFVWLDIAEDTCQFGASASESTGSTGGTTSGGVTAASSGFPWWLVVVMLALLVPALFVLRRRAAGSRFPVGTEIKQRNNRFAANAAWIGVADLSGLRQVSFKPDANGWLSECDQGEAVLIIRRIRDATRGDFVVVEVPVAGDDGEQTTSQRVETPHSFIRPSDAGAFIRAAGMVIRVESPDESQFDDESDDGL
jgi:hypothetical protein